MMSYWWLLWVVWMLLFLIPMVYGWFYRGWGPPYPRFVQRRRAQRAVGDVGDFNHLAWGWGGDLIWLALLIWMIWVVWALSAYWWQR